VQLLQPEYSSHELTLNQLAELVEEADGDFDTPITFQSDGEPVYIWLNK
jgi:hypothetical protein